MSKGSRSLGFYSGFPVTRESPRACPPKTTLPQTAPKHKIRKTRVRYPSMPKNQSRGQSEPAQPLLRGINLARMLLSNNEMKGTQGRLDQKSGIVRACPPALPMVGNQLGFRLVHDDRDEKLGRL